MSVSEDLSLLRCPVTKAELSELSPAEIDAVAASVRQGDRLHADGTPVSVSLGKTAVGTPDRKYVYRIDDDILCLLPALAIVHLDQVINNASSSNREAVRQFYDEFGWVLDESGTSNDTALFTAPSDTAQAYVAACNGRIASQLRGGDFLLDAACGIIPTESYVSLSHKYQRRICVDFSIRALREAKKKLQPGKGLFLLADLTRLPIKDGVVTDAISLHTLYHLPSDDQLVAIGELTRTVRSGGKTVIVYTWNRSSLMEIVSKFTMRVSRMKAKLGRRAKSEGSAPAVSDAPELFYNPRDRGWFNVWKSEHDATLKVWASTDTTFHRRFFRDNVAGKCAAWLVFGFESVFEPIASRYGQYPMFVLRKRA